MIRQAQTDDVEELARVHVQAWRETYVGMLPQEYLDGLSVERRRATWSEVLERSLARVWVVEEQGRLVGLCAAGPNRAPPESHPGEVGAIYLLRRARGRGLGRELMAGALAWLRAERLMPTLCWVLRENTAARGFYQAVGGRLLAEREESVGGAPCVEVAYGWER
ncbi:MAG: GNAT family N-acetyltransferase [Myxococcota bacterium]